MAKKFFGWGKSEDSDAEKLAKEEKAFDKIVADAPAGQYVDFETFMAAKKKRRKRDAKANGLPPELTEKFQFDVGFAFWPVEQLVYGADVEPGPQERGTCVGTSHAELLAARIATEIYLEHQPEQPLGEGLAVCPFEPYSYGVGRCNRNGTLGSSRLRGDGSNCSWQIAGTMAHGFLPSNASGLPGPPPGSTSSVQGSWGNNTGKVLNRWRPEAIVFDLENSTRIFDGDQAWESITDAHTPLQICSGWGFKYSKWDKTYDIGVYRPSGSWSHSMQIIGAFEVKAGQQRFCVVRNQWGRKAHRDCGRGVPLGSFVLYWEDFERWIKAAYVATIGEIKGKPQISKLLQSNRGFSR